MKLQLPTPTNPVLQQVNDSSILGTLNGSFNIDLTTDIGKVKTKKSLLVKRGVSSVPGDFGGTQGEGVGAIATLAGQIWLISGDAIWRGGNSPSDSITKDTSIGTPIVFYQDSDLKSFNSALIAVNQNDLYKYNPGTVTWSSIHTFSTSFQAHLLEIHAQYAYFSFDEYKIGRVNTSWTVSTTGTGTLDPNLPGYSVSFLKSDGNSLWIGYMNTGGNSSETSLIIRWDGSTENTPSAIYKIDTRGILAGTMVNGVPHVVDTNGRLLAFNGSFFQKIASFPLKSSEYLYGVSAKFNGRAIHPNGMTYDAITEEILINVSNVKLYYEFYTFPGGVWSYKRESGLTHKYSPSLQPIADSGDTNLVDYGQFNVLYPGAITCLGLRPDSGEKGRILFGGTICTGDTFNLNDMASTPVVLCTDDTANTAQSFAYLYTPELHSGSILENWTTIYTTYKKLLNTSDKIVVKYRTRSQSPQLISVYWADIDRITTTDDISQYSVGDEIQFVQGSGSGASFRITSITENTGTYTVVLDDVMPSGVIGTTALAYLDTWTEVGVITFNDTEQWKQFGTLLTTTSPFIQIKIAMRFTGDNEFYRMLVESNTQLT